MVLFYAPWRHKRTVPQHYCTPRPTRRPVRAPLSSGTRGASDGVRGVGAPGFSFRARPFLSPPRGMSLTCLLPLRHPFLVSFLFALCAASERGRAGVDSGRVRRRALPAPARRRRPPRRGRPRRGGECDQFFRSVFLCCNECTVVALPRFCAFLAAIGRRARRYYLFHSIR